MGVAIDFAWFWLNRTRYRFIANDLKTSCKASFVSVGFIKVYSGGSRGGARGAHPPLILEKNNNNK